MNQKQDVIDVSMSVFYSSSKGSKIRGSVRNIAEHLAKEPIERWDAVIARIADTMTRIGLVETGGSKPEFRERNHYLARAIAEQVLKKGSIPLIAHSLLGEEALIASRGRKLLAARFFAYVGSSLELTFQFCRIIFAYLVKREEERVKNGGRTTQDEVAFNVRSMIVGSLCSPAIDAITSKLWIYNLIVAADGGNDEAKEYYQDVTVYGVYANVATARRSGQSATDARPMIILSQAMLDRECPDRSQQLLIDYDNVRFVVPNHLLDKVLRINKSVVAKQQQEVVEATGFLGWFTGHAREIGTRFDEMGNTIISRPRYGVRPMGFDSFLVNVSTLRRIGITSFSFHPEGEQFPNVKIAVTVRKAGLGLCQLWMYLRDLELKAVDDIFLNWEVFDIAMLRSIFEYIVVDALHRIVAEKPKKDLDGEEIERTDEPREIVASQRVKVRPFIRRLPMGFEASDRAHHLAFLHLGWRLPDGMTFVGSHDRWAGLPAGKPTPLFKYTDDSIRKSITQH
ncbi:MAG: hypothetical protein V4481_02985 [Patescibacteria group bacterium]